MLRNLCGGFAKAILSLGAKPYFLCLQTRSPTSCDSFVNNQWHPTSRRERRFKYCNVLRHCYHTSFRMSSTQSPKATQVRRTRKSIAYLPSPDLTFDKENTENGSAATRASAKPASRKPRSKSLGPGGLDALKEDAGNRQKAWQMNQDLPS